jgi:hypothetical protein
MTKLSLDPNNLLFPPGESSVSDIPAGDGEIVNLFYSVNALISSTKMDEMLELYNLCIIQIPHWGSGYNAGWSFSVEEKATTFIAKSAHRFEKGSLLFHIFW